MNPLVEAPGQTGRLICACGQLRVGYRAAA